MQGQGTGGHMKPQRTIEFVGASDEDVAHLRLLIRKGRLRMLSNWQFGSEDEADLVIVDPTSAEGKAAHQRCQRSGKPCAVIWRNGQLPPEGLVLPVPISEQAVLALLNSVGLSAEGEGGKLSLMERDDGFIVSDLGDHERAAMKVDDFLLAAVPNDGRAPLSLADDGPVPGHLSANTSVQWTSTEQSTRSDVRSRAAPDTAWGLADSDGPVANIDPGFRHEAPEDLRILPLRDFLSTAIFAGPVGVQMPGLPRLVLDPKNGVFHTPGGLDSLELYCLQPLPVNEFRMLTSKVLAEVRESMPARPWSQLLWLYVLLNSNGRLASHLDPGGTYQVTDPLELEDDYVSQRRMTEALAEPMRLHEVVAKTGCSMSEVFDLVNAYDAIGALSWEQRASLRG